MCCVLFRLPFLSLMALLALALPAPLGAETRGAPDILVLGDSQLTFGAGVAFVDVLKDMAGSCGLDAGMTTGVIGVRSSTIAAWTGRSRKAKSAICDVDPKWKVNAAAYGTLSQGKNPYVQIGRGAQFQFCEAGQSPIKAAFSTGHYAPDLLILFLLGNATDRWAASPSAAAADVAALTADLPRGLPCVFMTTAPPYGQKVMRLRQKAQDNISRAFANAGNRCSFVAGFTPQTIAANTGQAASFRRKPSGAVKDPFHPTERSARRFLDLRRPALCAAIREQMARR